MISRCSWKHPYPYLKTSCNFHALNTGSTKLKRSHLKCSPVASNFTHIRLVCLDYIMGEWLVLLPHIWEVLGSNIGPELTTHSEICQFSSLYANANIGPKSTTNGSFPIFQFIINLNIPSFNEIGIA
jgi:hypothetical protein